MATKTTYQLDVLLGASTSPNFQSSLNKAATGIESLNSTAQRVAAGITAVFAAVNITRAIEDAVDTYTEFEQEMANVTAIAQATKSEYERMAAASLAAGRSTIYTATEAVSALEYMSLAGWDVSTSIEAQVPILRLAAATQKDLGTTSDLVTDSMSALQLEVGTLDEYLNKLVAGNNNANMTAEQLMQSLIKAGGASRTLGVDLDDTITALGILANNGTKGEEAGTALNSIFVRLASNSKALKELDRIGVSIFDENGSFIGFEESLIAINDAMADFTDEQRSLSLGKIAGTQRNTQFAYLLNAVTQDAETGTTKWAELEAKVENSGGALLNMYNTTTDTLLNAQAVLNSAKEDMQIRIVDVFSDDAKDFTLWLAEKLPEATDSIVAFAEAHSGDFADALETAGELIEGAWDVGVEAMTWLIGHKGAITGTLTAIATSLVAEKLVNTGKSLVSFASSLASMGPIGWGIAGLSVAAGAIVGIITAIDQANERAAAANLAAHFGSISLSLEDLDTLARQIVGEGSIGAVADLMDSIGESAESLDKATSILRDIQKSSWKINVDFNMTTDDYESYASQIENYIKGVESYAIDKGYEVHLATTLLFGSGSLQDAEISQFYTTIQAQLKEYGADLYNYLYDEVSGALLDGIIDPFENGEIQRRLEEINHITSAITEAENAAKFDSLTLKYNGSDLDSESIKTLVTDLGEYTNEVQEGAREAYQSTLTSMYARLELDDNYTQTDFDRDREEAYLAYHKTAEEAAINSAAYIMDTLENSYGDLNAAMQQYERLPQEIIDKYLNIEDEDIRWMWESSPMTTWNSIQRELSEGMYGIIDEYDLAGLDDFTKYVDQAMEILEEEAEEIERAGGELAPQTQEMLSKWKTFNDMLFIDGESMENVMSDYLSPGGQLADFINNYYPELDWLLSDEENSENIIQQANDLYDDTESALEEAYAKGFDIDAEVRLRFEVTGDIEPPALMSITRNTIGIARNARGGIYNHPLLTTFAEEGPEAAVPLDGSERAKSIWVQAGEILGMFQGKTRDQSLLEGISVPMQNSSPAANTAGNIHIELAPVITIQGSADKGEVQKALSMSVDELREMLNDIVKERERIAF